MLHAVLSVLHRLPADSKQLSANDAACEPAVLLMTWRQHVSTRCSVQKLLVGLAQHGAPLKSEMQLALHLLHDELHFLL